MRYQPYSISTSNRTPSNIPSPNPSTHSVLASSISPIIHSTSPFTNESLVDRDTIDVFCEIHPKVHHFTFNHTTLPIFIHYDLYTADHWNLVSLFKMQELSALHGQSLKHDPVLFVTDVKSLKEMFDSVIDEFNIFVVE